MLVDNDLRGSDTGVRYSCVTFDDGFASVLYNAIPELFARKIPCIIFVPTGSMGTHPRWLGEPHPDATETVMTPEHIRGLAASDLVRIGSHSVTHPNFRILGDAAAISELTRSKVELEAIVGDAVNFFSFPHGAFNDRSFSLTRLAGYKKVFTIQPTVAIPTRGEFVYGRIRVEPDDWILEFRLKARGAYRWLARASALKRELIGLSRADSARV